MPEVSERQLTVWRAYTDNAIDALEKDAQDDTHPAKVARINLAAVRDDLDAALGKDKPKADKPKAAPAEDKPKAARKPRAPRASKPKA